MLRHIIGQIIGPSDMPRKKRDDKLSCLVHHQDSRVHIFSLKIGGDGPYSDPRSAYKDKGIFSGKSFFRPTSQWFRNLFLTIQ